MTPKDITEQRLKIIAGAYGVTLEEVRSSERQPGTVRARDAIAYYLWSAKKWSLPRIGLYLRRDHSSVASALGRHMLRHGLGENWMVRRARREAARVQNRVAEQPMRGAA